MGLQRKHWKKLCLICYITKRGHSSRGTCELYGQSIIIKIHFPIDKEGFWSACFYPKCTPDRVLVVNWKLTFSNIFCRLIHSELTLNITGPAPLTYQAVPIQGKCFQVRFRSISSGGETMQGLRFLGWNMRGWREAGGRHFRNSGSVGQRFWYVRRLGILQGA